MNTSHDSRHQNRLTTSPPEEAYDRITGYTFARRYAAGKTVAELIGEEPGLGERMLSGLGGSVTSAKILPESGGESERPHLPLEDDSFDVVIALQVIERMQSPKHLLEEAKRILRPDGLLIISTPDKHTRSNERNAPPHPSEMYVQEFQELLDGHFGNVSLRRQGAVAGGFVSASKELGDAQIESVQLSSSAPYPGSGFPPTSLVLAVCSDGELGEDKGPYLLLDRDRRVFEEDEDHREDIELLRDEVRRMQETEVQSFQNAVALRTSEVAYLKSELGLPEDQRLKGTEGSGGNVQELKDQSEALKLENDKIKARLHAVEGSNIWRLTSPYRRGRILLDSWLKGRSGGNGDGR